MGDDVILQAVHQGNDAKFNSCIVGVIVTALLFFFPVGLFYLFIFYKTDLAFLDGVYLFGCIYVIGALANLMYYRFVVVGDDKIEIDKMSLGTSSVVFGKTFAAFFGILGFTMVAVALNPNLVRIFENTIGFAVCRSWGANKLLNGMLKSDLFDRASVNMSPDDKDAYMNYDFLLTTWHVADKKKLEEDIRASCTANGSVKRDLRFDFTWNAKQITEEKIKQLLDYIDLKYSVGHFTWVYIASVFALLASLVATIMN
jgi:hypothetical protein